PCCGPLFRGGRFASVECFERLAPIAGIASQPLPREAGEAQGAKRAIGCIVAPVRKPVRPAAHRSSRASGPASGPPLSAADARGGKWARHAVLPADDRDEQ